MSAQERGFIVTLNDNTEGQRAVESLAKSDRPVSRAFLHPMAAVLNRSVTVR